MEIVTNKTDAKSVPCVGTIGFFDGVHRGHLCLLEQVKQVAASKGLSTAVVTFPIHPRKVLHSSYQPELLCTKDEKLALLDKAGIDRCILLPFTEELSLYSAKAFMGLLKEDFQIEVLVIGYDHRFGHDRTDQFEDYCRYGKDLGMEVIQAKEFEDENLSVSSSVIRQLLKDGDLEEANHYLGYAYSLRGKVVSGHHIGREIGFPTANLMIEEGKLLPKDGVYGVFVHLDGEKKYKGMLNIGKRPTMENGNDKSVEVHILDFDRDIYAEELTLELQHYVRPEKKYDEISALIEQMRKDRDFISQSLSL